MNPSNTQLRIVAGIVLLVGFSYTRGTGLSAAQQPTRVTDQRGRQLVAEWLDRLGHGADAGADVWKGPLVVITNHSTAGGAEIAAAALLGNKRAQVVGERTFGDAGVRRTVQMEDGAGTRTLHPAQYLALAYGLMPELAEKLSQPIRERVL